MQIDATCVDPIFGSFSTPVQTTTTINGVTFTKEAVSFTNLPAGTAAYSFSVYLPPASMWQGRFWQNEYPLNSATPSNSDITAAAASGAYMIQVTGNNGLYGYRPDAAAAKWAKAFAATFYNYSNEIYGYNFGGSGGSYTTTGAAENTTGIWEGTQVLVDGGPADLPDAPAELSKAVAALRPVLPTIVNAEQPGGSGNPYAGLTPTQSAALTEISQFGMPLSGWETNGTSSVIGALAGTIAADDPTYARDFWSKPGYENSSATLPAWAQALLVDAEEPISSVTPSTGTPTSFTVSATPPIPSNAPSQEYSVDSSFGAPLTGGFGTLVGTYSAATKTFTLTAGSNSQSVLNQIQVGNDLQIDNFTQMSLLFYAEHEVPTTQTQGSVLPAFSGATGTGLYATGLGSFNQFLSPDGQPDAYAQRPFNTDDYLSLQQAGGGTFTGQINDKVVVDDMQLDSSAYDDTADWYSQRVDQAMGATAYSNQFRVYINANAQHASNTALTGQKATTQISYNGIQYQDLRDLAAWAENGTAPPASTNYNVSNEQVTLSGNAATQGGFQPVVSETADGVSNDVVPTGATVNLAATATAIPNTGTFTSAVWDCSGSAGTGTFPLSSTIPPGQTSVSLTQTCTYPTAGVYFPTIRVATQRQGDPTEGNTQVYNLGRTRVVVGAAAPTVEVNNVIVNATSSSGATVNYQALATDPGGANVNPANVVCTPPSGSTFPIGVTTVSCTATDSVGGTATKTFTVTVTDNPTISLPTNITAAATSPSGATVNYSATASDPVDGTDPVSCSTPSGSTFPVGTTTVYCSAANAAGNNAFGSFTVTVYTATLSLSKSTTSTGYGAAGDTIPYSYLVTNTGSATLTNVGVSDDHVASVSCPDSSLAGGASETCSGSYTVTQADVDAGSVTNTATAYGTDPLSNAVTSSPSLVTVDASNATTSISLTKSTTSTGYGTAGDIIPYSYLVTNTGTTTLSSVGVSDDHVASVDCPDTSLAPNASETCTGTYTVTQADVDNGSVTNTATASGTNEQIVTVTSDPSSVTVDASNATTFISLAKSTTSTGYKVRGTTIPYSYLVTNTGTTTLSDVGVTDDHVASVNCPDASLAPSASETCAGSYTVKQSDVDNGSVSNTATASGTVLPQSITATSSPSSVTVDYTGVQITTTSLPTATKGSTYRVTLAATGGKMPYTWSSLSGLPKGLTLSSNGVLSGKPKVVPGTYTVTVQVLDKSAKQEKDVVFLNLKVVQ
jgi:hypothetical protein